MSNQTTYKACKYCQEKFLQHEIYNHQKLCNQKQSGSLKVGSQPQDDQNQRAQSQFNNNQPILNSQAEKQPVLCQQLNVNGSINGNQIQYNVKNFIVPEKFKNKIRILEVRNLGQPSINASPIIQISQQKCEQCNEYFPSEEIDAHIQQCSSYIRFQEIVQQCNMEENQLNQGKNENHIISNNINVNKNDDKNYKVKQVEQSNQQIQPNIPLQNNSQLKMKQQIISQYLTILKDHKLLIQEGKRILAQGYFDNVRFKPTFDQKNCLICKMSFQEAEEIYLMKCCLTKYHIKCLHKHMTESIQCHQCKKPMFPPNKN